MARLSDLKLAYRLFMQAYPYRYVDWRPGAHLAKPLSQSRIALITSAGYFTPEQPPFDESSLLSWIILYNVGPCRG